MEAFMKCGRKMKLYETFIFQTEKVLNFLLFEVVTPKQYLLTSHTQFILVYLERLWLDVRLEVEQADGALVRLVVVHRGVPAKYVQII